MVVHFWFADIFTSRSVELELLEMEGFENPDQLVIYCDSCLPACTINPDGNRQVCVCCESRTRYHYSLTASKARLIPLSMYVNTRHDNLCKVTKEVTKKELLTHNTEHNSCGIGVVSSAISLTRDKEFREVETRRLAGRLAQASEIVWSAVNEVIRHFGPDRCFVHNGRLCEYYTVLACCKQLGTEVITHEITSSSGRWDKFVNGRIHDRRKYAELINDTVDNVTLTDLNKVADDFFTGKKLGTILDGNFTRLQVQGKLPPLMRHGRHVVVAFMSSQDEFAALGPDWDMPLFDSQLTALLTIIPDCQARNPDIEFIVRMHPNMQHMHIDDLNEYESLNQFDCTLVWPSEDIDSYALIESAHTILTFGSTIGCEATYWGRPVVQVGHSLFEHLDVCYIPQTVDEVIDLLVRPLKPKPKIGACKYAYTLKQSGTDFKSINWQRQTFRGFPLFTYLSPITLKLHYVLRFDFTTKCLAQLTRNWQYLRTYTARVKSQ